MAGLNTLFLLAPVVHMIANAALLVIIVNSSSRAYTSKCISQEGKPVASAGSGKLARFNRVKKAVTDENLVSYMQTNHMPASKCDQLA